MTISAVYIVRNSEETIKQSLNCALKFVDEIIVCDTGSEDLTISEITSLNNDKIKIVHFEWVNDFSKARNYAMQFATMDYILILDSDEMINQLKINDDFKGDWYSAGIHNRRYDAFLKKDVFHLHTNPRLFKRSLNPFYEGYLHENVSTWKEGKIKGDGFIEIVHTGYEDINVLNKKLERNLVIAQKQEIEQPDNLNNAYNLFKLYYALKDYSKAVDYGLMALWQPLNLQTKVITASLLYRLYFDIDKMTFAFFYLSLVLSLMPNQVTANIYFIEYLIYTEQFDKIDIVLNKIEQINHNKASDLENDFYYSKEDFEFFKSKINLIKNYGN